MRGLQAVIILFGFLNIICICTLSNARQATAQTEWIAYLSNSNGSSDVYVMSPDGENKRLIAQGLGRISQPLWSPNGVWLTASAIDGYERFLYKMHVTGRGVHAIAEQTGTTGYEGSVVWSPDGSFIAYTGYEDGEHGIYVVRASGGSRDRIASFERVAPSGLTWSPDGHWLTYNSANMIMRVHPDGRDNINLSSFDPYFNVAPLPSWSPDSQFLLFHSTIENSSVIYQVRFERPILNQLTTTETAFELPTWSPRGDYIALVGTISEGNSADPNVRTGQRGRDLYTMQSDGANLRQITDGFWVSERPQWSPDGEWLVFVSAHIGTSTIYRIRPDGSDLQQLTDRTASYRSPAWSSRINMRLSTGRLLLVGSTISVAPIWLFYAIQLVRKRQPRHFSTP